MYGGPPLLWKPPGPHIGQELIEGDSGQLSAVPGSPHPAVGGYFLDPVICIASAPTETPASSYESLATLFLMQLHLSQTVRRSGPNLKLRETWRQASVILTLSNKPACGSLLEYKI